MSVIGYIKGMSVDDTPRDARHPAISSDGSIYEDYNPYDWGGTPYAFDVPLPPVHDDPGLRCECEDYPCCGH